MTRKELAKLPSFNLEIPEIRTRSHFISMAPGSEDGKTSSAGCSRLIPVNCNVEIKSKDVY